MNRRCCRDGDTNNRPVAAVNGGDARSQKKMGKEYEKAISFNALYEALKKCSRSVKWKDSVAGYLTNGLRNTYRLRQSLLKGTYKIDRYHVFMVHEPKEREIVATRIKDRQFQRALCDTVLYPAMTRGFIYDNCACLRGKGVDFAMNRMETHLRRAWRAWGMNFYVLKCDIRHYFAETPHSVAKAALRKRVKDDEAYRRAAEIVDSFQGVDHGDGFGVRGIGLGSQVSQLVELAVLDDLDHIIKERLGIKHYIRYMDDFILIHRDRQRLKCCLGAIKVYLRAIGLELNDKTQIYAARQGVVFLKWHFYLTPTGKVIRRMSDRSINRERRKLRKLAVKYKAGERELKSIAEGYQSWRAHALRGNTSGIVRRMERTYFDLYGHWPPRIKKQKRG